ncbi:MAG: hypothetical protein K6F32_07390 [Bacilli bacterium]|nr:hypothetical protein [Bacilli bacterium]
MGRLLEKIKALRASENAQKKSIRKIVAVTALVIGNLASVAIGTIAWFSAAMARSNIDTVAGDLNVDIQKVTAYKYHYPYYKNSNDLLNYYEEGSVKSCVIEDKDFPNDPNFASQTVITLGAKSSGAYTATQAGTRGAIRYVNDENFQYFLIGDESFSGGADPWSTKNGVSFSSSLGVETSPAVRENVVIPVGAEFILFDARNIAEPDGSGSGTCYYFSSPAISGDHQRFEIVDADGVKTIRCKKSGIYSLTYAYDDGRSTYTLTIDASPRSDGAIIGNNMLDTTLISLENNGSVTDAQFSAGIHRQMTTVILDVEIKYKNASEIVAGLKVFRQSADAFDYEGDGNTTGYVNESQRNALRASDFYVFYPLFSDVAFEDKSALWSALHLDQAANSSGHYSKFSGAGSQITCELNFGGNISSAEISPSQESVFHCYIAIDYDYQHCSYFTNGERLAKIYKLDRDFGFYFTGTQIGEAA